MSLQKFTNAGTICDLHKGRSGRMRIGRSEDNAEMVRQAVILSSRKSIRRPSTETNIWMNTFHSIPRQDIHAFPYKIKAESRLTDLQKRKRLDFVIWFSENLNSDVDILKKLHMTDEYHAHLSGWVNKQNFRYWGTENSSNSSTKLVHRSVLKIPVWVDGIG